MKWITAGIACESAPGLPGKHVSVDLQTSMRLFTATATSFHQSGKIRALRPEQHHSSLSTLHFDLISLILGELPPSTSRFWCIPRSNSLRPSNTISMDPQTARRVVRKQKRHHPAFTSVGCAMSIGVERIHFIAHLFLEERQVSEHYVNAFASRRFTPASLLSCVHRLNSIRRNIC